MLRALNLTAAQIAGNLQPLLHSVNGVFFKYQDDANKFWYWIIGTQSKTCVSVSEDDADFIHNRFYPRFLNKHSFYIVCHDRVGRMSEKAVTLNGELLYCSKMDNGVPRRSQMFRSENAAGKKDRAIILRPLHTVFHGIIFAPGKSRFCPRLKNTAHCHHNTCVWYLEPAGVDPSTFDVSVDESQEIKPFPKSYYKEKMISIPYALNNTGVARSTMYAKLNSKRTKTYTTSIGFKYSEDMSFTASLTVPHIVDMSETIDLKLEASSEESESVEKVVERSVEVQVEVPPRCSAELTISASIYENARVPF